MLDIRTMTRGDVALGMRLKAQAGWNQTEADWSRMLDMAPAGCFVAECDGRAAGTVVTAVFASVAWIAMLLVDESLRGRGIGTALLTRALAHLDGLHVATVRLDATPLGQPIYAKLGFAPQQTMIRYAGESAPMNTPTPTPSYTPAPTHAPTPPSTPVASMQPRHLHAALALDRAATGADRRPLLQRLFDEHADESRVAEQGNALVGYLTARRGDGAWQIGPCIAPNTPAGHALLTDALSRHAGKRVYVDVPADHADAVALLEAHGLRPQRRLRRMCRGRAVADATDSIWASYGPEFG